MTRERLDVGPCGEPGCDLPARERHWSARSPDTGSLYGMVTFCCEVRHRGDTDGLRGWTDVEPWDSAMDPYPTDGR